MGARGLKEITKAVGGVIVKNSPTILTGLSVAGLVTTTLLAVRATPKALEILEEERDNRDTVTPDGIVVLGEEISTKDVVRLTWKCYVPAAIMGAVTTACIIGANTINLRRNAALAGLYTLSETALKEYKAKVVQTLGEGKAREIKERIPMDKVAHTTVEESGVINTGHGTTLCYDAMSGRYFLSDIEYIRKVINDLSRRMMSEERISLNEVYYALDLKGTKVGDMVGWHVDDGLLEPHFTSQLTENDIPCLVVDFDDDPRPIYID